MTTTPFAPLLGGIAVTRWHLGREASLTRVSCWLRLPWFMLGFSSRPEGCSTAFKSRQYEAAWSVRSRWVALRHPPRLTLASYRESLIWG